jgi:PLP dependent protein
MSAIAQRLASVMERIETSARNAGRDPGEITLVAVSKTHPPHVVLDAVRAGQRVFGENRVQEARAKIGQLPGDVVWHLIGPLQRNKVRVALGLFGCFHALDSIELARAIQRVCEETGRTWRVLLEVNLGDESSKFGFRAEGLDGIAEEILALDRVVLDGLMCIPPYSDDPASSLPHFVRLRELRDGLERRLGRRLPALSMGMSHDFESAIREGATIVRVGTAIFGERESPVVGG